MTNKKWPGRIFLVCFILLLCTNESFAQKDGALRVSTSNTVLNRYTRVTTDVLAGTNTVTVTNIAELNRDGIAYLPSGYVTNTGVFANNALSTGDLIMLYQAQGAITNVTNTMNYGAVTNYNGAGSYELAYVKSVSGNVITLNCNTRLSYYAARYVQVIRIPQYTTLTVDAGRSVVAIPWGAPTFGSADPSDLALRRGGFVGVLANSIVNNGSINANEAGFRGGTIENNTSAAGATFYTDFRTTDPALSAEKGESIAGYRTDYDVTGGRYGRGAAANGGGGGNAHNAGGGGGANGGIAANWFRGAGVMNDFGSCVAPGAWALDPNYKANGNALTNSSGGGSGGYTYSSANLDACTVGPSYPKDFISTGVPAADVLNATWGGDDRDAMGGLGGRPLSSTGMQSQIFFGGGGGAGDRNNNANADGGDGGGIVFLVVTNNISGTGAIQANGQNGFNTVAGHNDAPGGGGGGGTVLIQATSLANTINANGGNGGNQLITGAEAEGPGGGGGGGVISVKATTDTSTKTIIGGVNGTTSSTSVTEFKANGATSGNVGSIVAIAVNLNSSVCQTDLQVGKVVDNANPNVGDNVVFTITAKNNGSNAATGVTVTDALPAGYTFVSASTLSGTWTAPTWTIGNLANAATAILTITAKVNATGPYLNTATITSDLYDPTSGNDSSSVTPTVNIPPTANNVTNASIASTAGATTISTLSATDTDGTIASYTVVSLPTHGTLALGGVAVTAGQVLTPTQAANLTYAPSGTFTGNDTFTFTATDNSGAVDATPATFTIPVGNNPPTANNVTNASIASTAGATTITTLSATDTDGTIASYTVVSLPTHGTLALGGVAVTAGQVLTPTQAANLTYAPSGTFTGNDTFTFTATDNSGAVDATPATFTIPVGNNPPTANNVTNASIASTAGATTISTLSATDTDGTIASYTVVSLPAHGTLALGGVAVTAGQVLTPTQAANLTYAPSGTFTGNDTFTFTATDNSGAVDATPATFTIPVGNNPPTANNVTNASIASTAGATTISTLSATDTDGTIASYTVVSLPTHGTLALGGVAVTAGQVLTPTQAANLTYAPSGTFTGNDTFTFTATDNSGAVDATPATFTIPVGNNPPTANNVTNGATIASTAGATTISTLSATDTDGTIASYTVVSLATHGTLALGGVAVTAGQVLTPTQAASLTYTPSGTFTGNDTFTFTATDNSGAVDATPATFTIPVGNNPPTANTVTNASIASTAGATTISTLSATDTDGTIASYTVVSLPAHGTLALGGVAVTAGQVLTPTQAANLTYTPSGTFTGNDTFTFTATDNNGAVDATPATFTIPVGNNPPTANNVTNGATIASTAGATTISTLSATDTDGTIASYTVVSLPAHGTLALGGVAVTAGQVLTPTQAASLTYAPSGTFTGNDTFTFTATDNNGAVDASPATFTIPVGNNPPTADDQNSNVVIASTAGATSIKPLTGSDTDGTVVSYTVVSLPSHGTLALGGVAVTAGQVLTPTQAANLTYDPSGAFSGNDTFTFTVTDNNGAVSTPALVNIPVGKSIVNAVSDPITSVVGVDKIVKVINVLDNDTLNNNPVVLSDVNLSVITPDPKGVLTLKPDGTVELVPSAPAGTYTLTYEICEKANPQNCSPATVSVTVVAPTMTVTASSYCSNNTPYVSYNVVADNFVPTGLLTINWIDSANNVVATQTNMPLSGNVLWPGATVDGNNKPTDWPGWVLVNGQWIQGNDGFELTRPAVTMQFTLNPTKSVVVNYPSVISGCNAMPTFGIQAGNEDDVTLADGLNGSLEVVNVLDNDKLNGVPVKPEDVILKGLDVPKGMTLNADGTIDVAPGTAGGNYTVTYQICELANSSNCSTATVKIFVEVPAIAIVKTVVLNDKNANGYAEAGETLTYSFTITNTGNTDLQNIKVSDPLPGIVMSGGPISLAAGQSDSYSITGIYTLTQADVNFGSISNQATVSGVTKSGIKVSDKSDSDNLDGDKPTILELSGCVIKIFNAVSVNGDNKNERFYIQGLECYPDNTVQIYNRWGVLVFERDHYNNNDIAFRGISEGRVTIKDSNGLPEGTYYYIIKYKDQQSNPHQEAGYLYLTK
ncbi:Ig-like domain-containing protein [Flavobacterium chilense]|nr:Ig-like domain-containing protein [Flavobacterium chilense]